MTSELVRYAILNDLLDLRKPVSELTLAVRALPWDCAKSLVILSASHIDTALRRFISGEISADTIEQWANLVEDREDIGFASQGGHVLKSTIHILANPTLTQTLDKSLADELLAAIHSINL